MRNLILSVVAMGALSLAAAVPAPLHAPPRAESAPVASTPPPAFESTPVDPEPAHEDLAAAARATYLVNLMRGWTVPRVPTADYDAIARDMATAAELPEDGVLLAGLGYWESRYAAYVDDGRCNDPAWRRTVEGQRLMRLGGDCDGSRAHSLWQIHPIVDRASTLYERCNIEAVDGSRLGAARCALALAHASLQSTSDLTGYTGEPSWGDHPKADVRLDFVHAAIERHPYGPPRE